MSRLEARLLSTEKERDEAIQQLNQLQQQQVQHRAPVNPDVQRCSVLLQSQQLQAAAEDNHVSSSALQCKSFQL